jgi:hypothetical protein
MANFNIPGKVLALILLLSLIGPIATLNPEKVTAAEVK